MKNKPRLPDSHIAGKKHPETDKSCFEDSLKIAKNLSRFFVSKMPWKQRWANSGNTPGLANDDGEHVKVIYVF